MNWQLMGHARSTSSAAFQAAQVNSDNAVVTLTATARAGGGAAVLGAALTETAGADTAGVDIVFGDAAGTDDAARDAAHSSRSAYRVVSAALSVAKISTLICDPFNGTTNPKHIPGAIVRWTITITNAGAAAASLSTVADAVSASTTFDANLVTGAGGAAGCRAAQAHLRTRPDADLSWTSRVTREEQRIRSSSPTRADADGVDFTLAPTSR